MPTGSPQLRNDLVFSLQKSGNESQVVVKNPTSRQFFRLGEIEHFICRQLNGEVSVETVRERTEKKFAVPLASATLEQFIDTLRRRGLLREGDDQPVAKGADGWKNRLRGSTLYLRWKAFDPDPWLERLLPHVKFIFTRPFLLSSAALVLFALSLTVLNWDEIVRDLPRLYRLDALVLVWLTLFVVTTAHEFAHALTCKYFGGEVREMGFLLIYFHPAFYTNVSDAWLFPEKAKRLWVTFAGAYLDLFLWASATVLWRISDPATSVHFAALIVMAACGLKNIFNLNPLIKLDGYYLLADYLEIPNLRQKSFHYLRSEIARLRGRSAEAKEVGSRERRIYLAYGLLGSIYTWWMLGLVAFTFGRFLIGSYDAVGLLLAAAFVWMLFGKSLKQSVPSFSRLWDGGGSFPSEQVKKALGVSAAVILVLLLIRPDLKITGELRILPSHNADVRTEVEGVVEAVHVREGNPVRRGEPVATISNRELRAEREKVAGEIAEKRAKLKMLEVGPRVEDIEVAKTHVGSARARLNYPQALLGMSDTLFKRQLISRKELEEVRGKVTAGKRELEEAESKLRALTAGSRPEEIEAAKLEIDRLETQRGYIDERVRLMSVASPIDGVVTTPARDLKDNIGKYVQKGDLIAEVYELKLITAEILVPEREVGDVQVGQPVGVKSRAYPDRTFYGKVVSIGARAGNGNGHAGSGAVSDPAADGTPPEKGMVVVTTQLDNSSLLLKPEMTGKAKIFTGTRNVLSLLARRLARIFAVELWSWV
ncbi:MAG: efflux RND transporter periplasmic adaptor subunit [Candidatus Binatia bacterium]